MGLLDETFYPFDDPDGRELLDKLAKLYEPRRAKSLALGVQGLPIQRIEFRGSADDVWQSILSVAARSGKLRDLALVIIDDPESLAVRPLLQRLMEDVQLTAEIPVSWRPTVQPDSRLDAGAVRQFVDEALSDEDVNDLAIDHFPAVYRDFSSATGRRSKIRQLVEYADRHDRLGELVRWVRESNPAVYARHEQQLRT